MKVFSLTGARHEEKILIAKGRFAGTALNQMDHSRRVHQGTSDPSPDWERLHRCKEFPTAFERASVAGFTSHAACIGVCIKE